ncbi:MAG TPA: MBL fold metallo-hydrolase [Thermoanaerobaculia bacterium]|jgi:beta-lactamase superfamily II metal-dependent hydrolase|nr:MBL fold metallo-hydrolase [Thermoanaerobaculia bacterium]
MSQREVSIRMYNVGFGDCFLVTIPTDDGDRRILFDCGSMAKGNKSIEEVAGQVIGDLGASPKIDVVVCTHRHRDHVSGFAKPGWSDVDVTEVWMPWTENPEDAEATRIRDGQTRLATALARDLTLRLNAAGLADPEKAQLDADFSLVENAQLNESAMETLHSGFKRREKAKRRFLPETASSGDLVTRFTTEALPGVVIHVLGPSRDEEIIRDIDPPAGKSYMQLSDAQESGAGDGIPEPFSSDWWAEGMSPFVLSEDDKKKIRSFSEGFTSPVAAALDAAINGTSLMLVLQIGDLHLLFPGDAQWGTWNAVLRTPKWKNLLRRVRFYKIGHHGSHNATPIEFVEDAIDTSLNVIAMASTRAFGSWKVPLPELLTQLASKNAIIARSDRPTDAPAPAFTVADDVIEARLSL